MVLCVRADGRDWLCDLGFGSYGIPARRWRWTRWIVILPRITTASASAAMRKACICCKAWVDGEGPINMALTCTRKSGSTLPRPTI